MYSNLRSIVDNFYILCSCNIGDSEKKNLHFNMGCLVGDTGLFHKTSMYVAQCDTGLIES